MPRQHLLRRALLPVLPLTVAAPARAAAPATAPAAAKDVTLGQKVLAFAQKHKGEQVGNGECAVLASEALKSAGAARRGTDAPDKGDYTWGKLILTLQAPSDPTNKPTAADGKPAD